MANTKVKEVTQGMINALAAYTGDIGDTDGGDSEPTVVDQEKCTFGMHAWVDYERPEKGQVMYTVTVEAKFVPDE